MRIMIAYDGSAFSEAAVDDLARAGLGPDGEALVISVAEVWLPPDAAPEGYTPENPYIEELIAVSRAKGEAVLEETRRMAERGRERVAAVLTGYRVESEATYGSPAWEMLSRADTYRPDMIVVGSHGYGAISRFFLGSISQKILTEAHSTVRVARSPRAEADSDVPARIAIGFDLSLGAERAVEAVAARSWPDGTEVLLIYAADGEDNGEYALVEKAGETAMAKIRAAGLEAELRIVEGGARSAIVDTAEEWEADAIFVGANAWGSRLERFLIGSTSAAVAARAHCTVEVVRFAA